MGKFKVPSWLQPAADGKKLNRRSFSGFSSQRRLKHESLPVGKASSPPPPPPPTPPPSSRLMELAAKITVETEKLDSYVREKGLQEPGFAVDAPDTFPPLPPHLQTSRLEVVCAAQELESLIRGPRESVRWAAWSYLDTLSLQIINNYGIAQLVPLDRPMPLSQLQTKTTLDATNLARVLRHAMTKHVFCEISPGLIGHTAASRLLAHDESLQDWVGFNSEDVFPAAAHALEALKAYPEATSLTTTGFNFAFDTVGKEPMFVTFGKDPQRARRMGGAMASLSGGEGYEVSHFVDSYDLTDVDARAGTFVDRAAAHLRGPVCRGSDPIATARLF
ncbi:hypothetical protein XA68_11558 [Ophiocordyceps unilateralis]|uniref:Uncharacterized protein n=1 Tax=Ophiocordyceps unilateralis TaxID=268505 RepID=A0A2A9P224_OPHUN|nr:hypothetical protein XA68_11558 [Ophiocordyceps unilateralis]